MSMNFAYAIVYVPDVSASLAFFERAFGLKTRFLHESGAYGEVETGAGGARLAFVDHATSRPLAAPVAKPWGQTVAYVRCPDGGLVELCTAMG